MLPLLQNQLPKNVDPTISYLTQETLTVFFLMFFLLIVLQCTLYIEVADTIYADECDHLTQLLLN